MDEMTLACLIHNFQRGVMPPDKDVSDLREFFTNMVCYLECTGLSNILLSKINSDIAILDEWLEERKK